ncbi:MAG: DUF2909 domain-containing protein [Pseudomonadales bacterium]
MWLKPTIAILFSAILLSLAASVIFLIKDQGSRDRTRKLLGIRILLAIALMACITYGLWTGQLTLSAPWY